MPSTWKRRRKSSNWREYEICEYGIMNENNGGKKTQKEGDIMKYKNLSGLKIIKKILGGRNF